MQHTALGSLGAWRFEGLVVGNARLCPGEQGRASSSGSGGRCRTGHCLWPWRNVQSTGGHKEWKFSALQGDMFRVWAGAKARDSFSVRHGLRLD